MVNGAPLDIFGTKNQEIIAYDFAAIDKEFAGREVDSEIRFVRG